MKKIINRKKNTSKFKKKLRFYFVLVFSIFYGLKLDTSITNIGEMYRCGNNVVVHGH